MGPLFTERLMRYPYVSCWKLIIVMLSSENGLAENCRKLLEFTASNDGFFSFTLKSSVHPFILEVNPLIVQFNPLIVQFDPLIHFWVIFNSEVIPRSSVSDCTCGENLESTFDWRWDKVRL